MSRGLIVEWQFESPTFNRGVIAGCSPDVHSEFFGFNLAGVSDAGLRNLLAQTPQFRRPPNCNEGPNPRWVSFDAIGGGASGIFRIFP